MMKKDDMKKDDMKKDNMKDSSMSDDKWKRGQERSIYDVWD